MDLVELDDDARLALKLLDDAPEGAVLMLPCGLDNAARGLVYCGFAEITDVAGIPLVHITPAGREYRASTSKESTQ
jgi:hypothetical protein